MTDMMKDVLICGDADAVGERLSQLGSSGIDGLVMNLPANGHIPGRVALLGKVADAALG